MMVWKVGDAYEKTRTMLIDKILDARDFEVLIAESVSEKGNVCYFCRGAILKGYDMYEVTRNFVSYGRINQETFFADVACMAEIRGKNK